MHKFLAVFAHPDDETFICGGTLAKAAKEGNQVILVCATKGEMGRRMGIPPTETRESIAYTRELELRDACEALGIAKLHFLGFRDKTLEILPVHTLKKAVLGYLKSERPDIVVTFHVEWGGHPDHCAIGTAATSAFVQYKQQFPHGKLFYVCSGDMIRHPEQYGLSGKLKEIDVAGCLQEKLYAFRAHLTQSQINTSLWGDDVSSASKLWSLEYLVDAQDTGVFKAFQRVSQFN